MGTMAHIDEFRSCGWPDGEIPFKASLWYSFCRGNRINQMARWFLHALQG